MSFKDQLNAEFSIVKKLERTIKQHYLKDSESVDQPERRLVAALFHQAVLDCFCQIKDVRYSAREWIFSGIYEEGSAEWYADIADFQNELHTIREYLFKPDFKRILK